MGRRYFIIGVILLFAGLQLRSVDSFVLTSKASEFVESKLKGTGLDGEDRYEPRLYSAGPYPNKTIAPPDWLGWAFLSVGGVLVIHGLTLGRLD